MIRFGVVSEVDAETCRVRVRFDDLDGVVSQFLPVLVSKSKKDRYYHLPDLEEHVAVALDENGEDGVVLGAVYSEPEPPPVTSGDKAHVTFEDGSSVEFDRASGVLKVDAKSQVILKAPAVDLGDTGGQKTAMGEDLKAYLEQLVQFINTQLILQSPAGPTVPGAAAGGATAPSVPDFLSSVVKSVKEA